MLLTFTVENYRSFRDLAELSLEAVSLKQYNEVLLHKNRKDYLPVIAVYGKNSGGKSNLIRAFWLAVQFICNAQRTQHEKALIPVRPFELDDYSKNNPTSFEFEYINQGIKYQYGFSATKKEIYAEYLNCWPKGQRAEIFSREKQNFHFPENSEKKKKDLISEAVAANQLFFAVSCIMNYEPCIQAMSWFRNQVLFSRDFTDISNHITDYAENPELLKSILEVAKVADVGIQDITFEVNNHDVSDLKDLPENMPQEIKDEIERNLNKLMDALQSSPNEAENKLRISEIKATSFHSGQSKAGENGAYPLSLSEESDGTKRLMSIYPAVRKSLSDGGIFIVDELERELHPLLVDYVVGLYQNSKTNPHGAQLIFTTHNTELMNLELLRRDQIRFVDKDKHTGASELYSLSEFSPRKDENIHKGYMLGKYGATPLIEEA